jgi:predicted Zn-dependent protease with MMP-like domain
MHFRFALFIAFLALVLVVSPFNAKWTTKSSADAVKIPTFMLSNYKGYTIVERYEHNVGTAEPKYIIVYKSNAGTKYVRNKFIGDAIRHRQYHVTTLSYTETDESTYSIGYAFETSVGAKAEFFGAALAWEISVKVGNDYATSTDVGQSVTYKILSDTPSDSYILAQSIEATEYIVDVYDATWRTEQETYKEGKDTKTRNVQVHHSYSIYKNSLLSNFKMYMADKDATPFYELVKK